MGKFPTIFFPIFEEKLEMTGNAAYLIKRLISFFNKGIW
jgi:hypothetical protein